MYETFADSKELRQGDILKDIYLPRFGITDAQFVHKFEPDGTLRFSNQTILPTTCQFAAVISQCCEFNPGKRNSFSLAGLIGLSEWLMPARKAFGANLAEIVPWNKSASSKHTTDQLLKANSIEADSEHGELVNVYFLNADGKHFLEPHLIDFTRVFSVRMKEMERVLKNKVLQLDDEHRVELQYKLAYFYARPAN